MENDKPGLTLMLSGEDRTAILDLIESLRHANDKWTCFHCGFVTNDYKAAEAHFGERDDPDECKPLCKWWKNMTPEERGQQLQDTIQQLNAERDHSAQVRTQNEGLEHQVNGHLAAITSFKPFRECTTMTQVFQIYDAMEGRALLAEKYLDGIEEFRKWFIEYPTCKEDEETNERLSSATVRELFTYTEAGYSRLKMDTLALKSDLCEIQQLLTSVQNIIHRRNKETT